MLKWPITMSVAMSRWQRLGKWEEQRATSRSPRWVSEMVRLANGKVRTASDLILNLS